MLLVLVCESLTFNSLAPAPYKSPNPSLIGDVFVWGLRKSRALKILERQIKLYSFKLFIDQILQEEELDISLERLKQIEKV